MKLSSMPLTLMQCRVQFGCQGLPGFVAAVPACLNHFKSKWCNEQSYLVPFPLFCQATHKYLDPTQKLTNLLKERRIGKSDFPGGKVFCGGSTLAPVFSIIDCCNAKQVFSQQVGK